MCHLTPLCISGVQEEERNPLKKNTLVALFVRIHRLARCRPGLKSNIFVARLICMMSNFIKCWVEKQSVVYIIDLLFKLALIKLFGQLKLWASFMPIMADYWPSTINVSMT